VSAGWRSIASEVHPVPLAVQSGVDTSLPVSVDHPQLVFRIFACLSGFKPAVTAAQKVVLYEEDPADPNGKRFVGSVIWRTAMLTTGLGQPPELAIRADVEVPERNLAIPNSSMVFDHYEVKEIRAELLGVRGVAVEKVRHADLVSFTCLKAFALDQRDEPKDAHDLIFCVENGDGGLEAAAKKFQSARSGRHGKVVEEALRILAKRFTDDGVTEGYRKDGSVAVARFEIGGDGEGVREVRLLRQREASDLIARFMKAIG
jgi:hypothetical protein